MLNDKYQSNGSATEIFQHLQDAASVLSHPSALQEVATCHVAYQPAGGAK